MDGEEPILFCGIERLQVNIGVAVAVALDIAVNRFFNHRLQRCPILSS